MRAQRPNPNGKPRAFWWLAFLQKRGMDPATQLPLNCEARFGVCFAERGHGSSHVDDVFTSSWKLWIWSLPSMGSIAPDKVWGGLGQLLGRYLFVFLGLWIQRLSFPPNGGLEPI